MPPLPRRFARDGDDALLGDEHAVAHDIVLAQVKQTIEQTDQRGTELAVIGGEPVEPLSFGLERVGMDLEQAVQLGLEVVIQRRRAQADVGGDVGPFCVLVAIAAEMVDR